MDFDGDKMKTTVQKVKEEYHIVIVDLCGKKDTKTILQVFVCLWLFVVAYFLGISICCFNAHLMLTQFSQF